MLRAHKDVHMAKMFNSGKWKRRLTVGLSLSMAAMLSLGIFSACKTTEDNTAEEDETPAIPTDTQLLKNGDFRFYSEMMKDEKDLRVILNSPTSWSFSSGSPSSDTKSGLIDLKYWDTITASKYEFTSVNDAYKNWDKGSIYDKLNFFYKCDNTSNKDEYKPFENEYDALAANSAEKKFFKEQSFSSVDFEDVQYLRDELGEGEDKQVSLYGETKDEGILMIHNRRTSDGAVGTAQSYSSSTTITLPAGTAAEISVWVKTAQLRHYYDDLKADKEDPDGLPVTSEAGAYIGLTHTVGGTTLDQMQIKNINTEVTNPKPEGNGEWKNNGWEQYTMYVRASTFATTTVKLVLGLGQGNSDDRYESVNGYALFDDAKVTIIDSAEYETKTESLAADYQCNIHSEKTDKLFDATALSEKLNYAKTFALNLYAGFNASSLQFDKFGLTEEKSGNRTYTSKDIDKNLDSNIGNGAKDSIAKVMNLSEIQGSSNYYLSEIAKKDFDGEKFPFANKNDVLMLLSTNGAAYTAKTTQIPLGANERMLLSFFVKTSEVIKGRTGATVTLVDGENKTNIAAFDSTTIATVDIDDDKKDIYDGWVQCFFFVSNDTDAELKFSLEFSIGPTAIVSSNKYAYGQGYAAFANFETTTLSKTELSYASTGDRAKKVSLTGIVEDTTVFDEADKVHDIEKGLGSPVNFKGVNAGSKMLPPVDGSEAENKTPEELGLNVGLLNYKYAENYASILGGNSWEALFQDQFGKTALQPLVIMNKNSAATSSYGYFANATTISASSYQKISLRVKLSPKATATVYLTDTSEFGSYNSFLTPNAPKVTYWYDEDGNIVNGDPSDKDNETKVVFELQENGLYLRADSDDKTYYANLKNYKEKDGNLVTSTDTIAYYGHDGKYYAYRTENADGTYSFNDDYIVTDLYDLAKTVENVDGELGIARYDFTELDYHEAHYESVITVKNDSDTVATDWITVTFYVHTGNEAKNYRLELWAGDRYNATDGIPENGYVFFDRYASTSISNYDSLLDEAVADLSDEDGNTLDNGNLIKDYAMYYTFTYYDSVNYLRYDVNEDEDKVGNLYASYDQSAYSEEIVYLIYNDTDGSRTGSPSYIRFLNYAASDVTVTPDSPDDGGSSTPDKTEKEPISTGDILLIISSLILGVVIIFVIVMLVIRHIRDKRKKTAKAGPVRDLRYRPTKKKEPEVESVPEEEEENIFVKNRKAKEAAKKAAEAEEQPVEEPAEEPVEEAPVEEPVETEEPAEEASVEESSEELAEEPAEPVEEPAEEPAESPADEDNKDE